ncbi:hypothetical protein E2C01_035983 [Portunus trituberculatus]|uniref:Uncharacterized protein n=1 Tax=Portunus trituberculatus TaxID=210409 RepID=A0A5B7F5Q5_PORTR|nr:hypothetical protein [Portunus trituberculatus]
MTLWQPAAVTVRPVVVFRLWTDRLNVSDLKLCTSLFSLTCVDIGINLDIVCGLVTLLYQRQKTLHLEDDPNINAMEDTRSSQVCVHCHLTSRHQEGHLSYLPLKDAIENHDDNLQFMMSRSTPGMLNMVNTSQEGPMGLSNDSTDDWRSKWMNNCLRLEISVKTEVEQIVAYFTQDGPVVTLLMHAEAQTSHHPNTFLHTAFCHSHVVKLS